MVRRPTKIVLFALLSLPTAFGSRVLGADEPSWTVGELVVTAKPRGPVLWRVSKGDSEVWILGALPNMPRHQTWNTARVEQEITGANVVLTPPRATIDLFTVLGVLTHLNLPRGRTLDQELPPDLEARFAHARALAGASAARYARLKPSGRRGGCLPTITARPSSPTQNRATPLRGWLRAITRRSGRWPPIAASRWCATLRP